MSSTSDINIHQVTEIHVKKIISSKNKIIQNAILKKVKKCRFYWLFHEE